MAQTLDTISFTINQQKQITSKSLQAVTAIIAHWSCPTHTQAYAPAHTHAVETHAYIQYTYRYRVQTLIKSHTNACAKPNTLQGFLSN